jgi:hypothetical protein
LSGSITACLFLEFIVMLCLAGFRSCATSLQELRGWWVCQKKARAGQKSTADVCLFNTCVLKTTP